MHPAVSLAYDQLYAAGLAAGFDLRGNGYRSAGNNGEATRGKSCHGVGMAVDISMLVPKPTGPKYDSLEAVWASPVFAWVCGNAERFGFVVPRNAMPEGMRCGGVVGNGAGGCINDTCGHFESWHVEAVASRSPTLTSPEPCHRAHRHDPRPARSSARPAPPDRRSRRRTRRVRDRRLRRGVDPRREPSPQTTSMS